MPSLKNPKADLRKLYNRTLKISLIVSLTIIIAAFKFSPDSHILSPQNVVPLLMYRKVTRDKIIIANKTIINILILYICHSN